MSAPRFYCGSVLEHAEHADCPGIPDGLSAKEVVRLINAITDAEAWNAAHPVGTLVRFESEPSSVLGRTSSPAKVTSYRMAMLTLTDTVPAASPDILYGISWLTVMGHPAAEDLPLSTMSAAQFNAAYPVGTRVLWAHKDGALTTVTSGIAQTQPNGTVVVPLAGRPHEEFAISALTIIEPATQPELELRRVDLDHRPDAVDRFANRRAALDCAVSLAPVPALSVQQVDRVIEVAETFERWLER